VNGWIPPSFGQADTSLVADQEEAFVALVGDAGAGREAETGLAAESGCGQDTAGYHLSGKTETPISIGEKSITLILVLVISNFGSQILLKICISYFELLLNNLYNQFLEKKNGLFSEF
jgi:hypothetical protein